MSETNQAEFKGWAHNREAQWAYLAGIFDGEGCVRIQRNKPRIGGKSPSFALHVSISNTDRRLIDFLVEMVGGGYVKVHNEKRTNQRDCYFWTVSASIAVRFMKAIRPYLILKANQVDLALEFCARIRPGCTPLTDSEISIREEMRVKLSGMKGSLRATG